MATLDELQQQLAALSARVDAITTPPDDYYTSKYSGEEIDAGIEKTGSLPESWPLPIASGGTGADSAQLALFNLGARPNRNLLDNWYFVGGGGPEQFPINQRGQTHYDVTDGSTIDRWALTGTGGSMDVQDDGVLLTSPGQYATYFTYKIPSEIVSNLAGKQICLSALWGDDTGYGGSLNIYFDDKWSNYVEITANDLNSRVLTVPDGVKSIYVNFGANGAGTCKIKAAKLELGSHQTLAHQEGGKWVLNEIPNYAEQLARCQRYLIIETAENEKPGTVYSSTSSVFTISTAVQMRTTPVLAELKGYEPKIALSDGSTVLITKEEITVLGADVSGVRVRVDVTGGKTLKLGPASIRDCNMVLSAEL